MQQMIRFRIIGVVTEAGAHNCRLEHNFDRDRVIDTLGCTDGGSCVFRVTVVGVVCFDAH